MTDSLHIANSDSTSASLIDSINLLEPITENFALQTVSSYWILSFNEILTLIIAAAGIGVAIYQFRKQMRKNREEQKDAAKKNWYFSVIVLPQLDSINAFYKKLIDNLHSDIKGMPRRGTSSQVWISKTQAKRKDEINAFFDHIQSLIRSFDIPLSRKVGLHVEELEDIVTKTLDDCFIQEAPSMTETRRAILLNKKEIISTLYTRIITNS